MEENENFIHDKFGYCYYIIDPGERPIIFNLYTEPWYRNKGHARRHLEFVINEIRKTGYKDEIDIEVTRQEENLKVDSEKLALFYKSMGLEVSNQSILNSMEVW